MRSEKDQYPHFCCRCCWRSHNIYTLLPPWGYDQGKERKGGKGARSLQAGRKTTLVRSRTSVQRVILTSQGCYETTQPNGWLPVQPNMSRILDDASTHIVSTALGKEGQVQPEALQPLDSLNTRTKEWQRRCNVETRHEVSLSGA